MLASRIPEIMMISPPASADQIERLSAALGLQLPDDYRALLAEADGVSANLVQIYATEEIPDRNLDYEVAIYASGYFLIGSVCDFPVLLRGGESSPVFENDWGDMTPGGMTQLAPSLSEWISIGCPNGTRVQERAVADRRPRSD